MTVRAISRFQLASFDSPPQDMHERIAAVQAKAGFMPGILCAAHRPAEFRAFFEDRDVLMETEAGRPKA